MSLCLAGVGGPCNSPSAAELTAANSAFRRFASRGRAPRGCGRRDGDEDDQADIPAQQHGAQAPARFSRPHGHQGRPQDHQRPPRARPQEPERLSLTLPVATPVVRDVPLTRLRRRADFLRAARARRRPTPGFILQARRRSPEEGEPGTIRVGFTCSRKVGNAVARNRAKRRLREAARLVLPLEGHPDWDYVLIGRRDETSTRPFDRLLHDLGSALARVHGEG